MSIATDEAAQKYPEPTDADDPMYKYVEAIADCPQCGKEVRRNTKPDVIRAAQAEGFNN